MGSATTNGHSCIRGVRIAGTGVYLPGPPLDQATVSGFLGRYPDGLSTREQQRILEVSGIAKRHYAISLDDESKRETSASMAAEAGRRALDAAGWAVDDVDYLVVTTVVPDQLMPPTSTLVQELLGIEDCAELEISANCTAPTKGLVAAVNELRLGNYRRALVCNAQFASFGFVPPWMNPGSMCAEQAHLRWILSDGAAALALETGEPGIDLKVLLQSRGAAMNSGMSIALGAAHPDIAAGFAGGDHQVYQPPLTALKNGIRLAREGLGRLLESTQVSGDEVDHFIPSVSSIALERRLYDIFGEYGIRREAWRTNYTQVGYVGSVAVPMVLDQLSREGRLQPGDTIVTVAEESSKWMFAGTVFRWNPA